MKKRDLIYTITSYVTMTLSIIMGLLFIMQVIRIYDANNLPMYSRDLVGKYLLQILPCIILFVLAVIFAGVYATIKGISNKDNVKLTNKDKYDNMMRLFDENDLKGNSLLKREQLLRKIMIIANIVIAGGSILVCLYYLLFVKEFDGLSKFTPQVIDALVHCAPWVGITLVYSLINIYVCDFSYRRSLEILKQVEAQKSKKPYVAPKYEVYVVWGLRGLFITLAITLIIVGLVNDEAQSVLLKAANICTECVGLG